MSDGDRGGGNRVVMTRAGESANSANQGKLEDCRSNYACFRANPEPMDPPLDWTKINAVYNTRNMIVHRGQRRMPPFEDIKAQVLEVRSFVIQLQAALRNGGPNRA